MNNQLFKTIAPMGVRQGPGTFNTYYDPVAYPTVDHAYKAEDFVLADFVESTNGVVFMKTYHIRYANHPVLTQLAEADFSTGPCPRDRGYIYHVAQVLVMYYQNQAVAPNFPKLFREELPAQTE